MTQPSPGPEPEKGTSYFVALHAYDPTPGHWCDECALPSAFSWKMCVLSDHGIYPLGDLVACPKHVDRAAVERDMLCRTSEVFGWKISDPTKKNERGSDGT